MAAHLENDKEFEARMDMNTLKEAEEIKSDSKRSNAAKTQADKEIKALAAIGTLITSGKSDKKTLIT